MRVGVVGCGYWGSKHARVFQSIPAVEGVVVIDESQRRTEEMLALYPGMQAFASLELAAPHLDAVVIATPPRTHATLGLQALRLGLHALVEKPLAVTVEDSLALMREAELVDRTLMVGHTFEYNAAVWALKDLVQSGSLGETYYVDSARLNLGLYQTDVNVLWDLAPHDISIMNFVLGRSPDAVQAWGACHAHRSLEDVAYIRLYYRELNVTAQIHVSWLDPCKVRRTTVVGSQKMAVYNDLSSEERLRVYDKGVDIPHPDEPPGSIPLSYRQGDITSPHIRFEEPLRLEAEDFIRSIASKSEPVASPRAGLAVVQVLEAADQSLRGGHTVELRDVMERATG